MVNSQDPNIFCSQWPNCEKLTVKILTVVAVVTTGHTRVTGVTPHTEVGWVWLVRLNVSNHPLDNVDLHLISTVREFCSS